MLHPDEGSMGKYSPEYQLSSRVAMSQLKEPRVMKVDTRGTFSEVSQVKGSSNAIVTVAFTHNTLNYLYKRSACG